MRERHTCIGRRDFSTFNPAYAGFTGNGWSPPIPAFTLLSKSKATCKEK